ncbi:beta-N-acetylhexosaminidase [Actinomadura logoneensis]|uniref:beta-N-acetylhexosaminidase n=1 Tax=Actinomadura logoneensis TaxID=2293572 RepID=UPI001F302AA7|nr:beta-N-acetylhexosaminidase [Actinomadura logoneensis]
MPFDGTVRTGVDTALPPEGYRLTVEADGSVEIVGGDEAGVFRGRQTLRQLLGPDAFRQAGPPVRRELPQIVIEDAPRFAWRGFMLDIARHFMPKSGILRYIDLIAAHKLNVLHLHLTDDQGWRIEIKRYPRLTEVGSSRPRTRLDRHGPTALWDERPHGGFLTQDDLREIVAYAAERHITVVPEIDLPGHTQAAIAAYPELGNTDVLDTAALGVKTDWGVNPHVLNANEATIRFLEGVLEEVLDVFPGRFVHIGGDECPKDEWKASPSAQERIRELGVGDEDGLQSWIIRHFDRWLTERGRRLVGWDEILEGGLAEGATVMSWRGRDGGVAAAKAGHDVVMCPMQEVYLDHRQSDDPDEPVPFGWVQTLRDVHAFEPVPPELAGTEHAHRVLGAQANMWTEHTENQQRVDYMVFPRLAAFAEAVWSPSEGRDPDDFERRMREEHYARLDAMGVDYRRPGGPLPHQRRPGIPGRPFTSPKYD